MLHAQKRVKQEAHQLMRPGEAQLKYHCMSLMMAKLFDSLRVGLVLRTFIQYSIIFCSRK